MALKAVAPRRRPIWLREPTRGAGLGQRGAIFAILLVVVLVAAAFRAPAAPPPPPPPVEADGNSPSDLAFYNAVVDGVRAGGDYYRVAADAQRAVGFPLRPFVTMRLPTLACVEAALPPTVATLLLRLLALLALLAWWERLRDSFTGRSPRVIALLLLAGGELVFVRGDLVSLHELWAGLLLSLSLARWRPGRWVEPAALALCAALIRETAILYAGVMLAAAVLEGRRRESLGWIGVIGVFGVVVLLHAHAVGLVTRPGDAASPGWAGLLGFGFFVRTLASLTPLAVLPLVAAAPLIALALVGWAGWRDEDGRRGTAARGAATLGAYVGLIAACARADTYYWGLLVASFLPLGLVAVPDTLRDLVAATLDRRRITVTRVIR